MFKDFNAEKRKSYFLDRRINKFLKRVERWLVLIFLTVFFTFFSTHIIAYFIFFNN